MRRGVKKNKISMLDLPGNLQVTENCRKNPNMFYHLYY